jgi:hypothetical protein
MSSHRILLFSIEYVLVDLKVSLEELLADPKLVRLIRPSISALNVWTLRQCKIFPEGEMVARLCFVEGKLIMKFIRFKDEFTRNKFKEEAGKIIEKLQQRNRIKMDKKTEMSFMSQSPFDNNTGFF